MITKHNLNKKYFKEKAIQTKVMDKLEKCERETVIIIDELTGMCNVYTTIQSDIRKFKSKGWPIIRIEYYDPDTQQEILSCEFEAPRKYIGKPKQYYSEDDENKPKRKIHPNSLKAINQNKEDIK